VIYGLFLLSFLIGSIPTGLLVARSRGVDLRSSGSGNIGATNVLRTIGKTEAAITLIGDLTKGAVPVVLARALQFPPEHATLIEGMAGLSAVLGHNFSLFLKFRGGKGVATSLGSLFALTPTVGLFTVTLWLMTVKWTRYSSLGALVSFGLLPLSVYIIDYSKERVLIALGLTALIFLRHVSNIRRLVSGREPKIGQKA
jgi:glycerol-3-phosphate acyltransferase PlsY